MRPEPDDDDFVELERTPNARAQMALLDVSVRITVAAIGRVGAMRTKARATISFRGAAGKWLAENGPRFRVLIGGADANYLRVVPDAEQGRYGFREARNAGKTKIMSLNAVSVWPRETRQATKANWKIIAAGNYMSLELPPDFAKPKAKDAAEAISTPSIGTPLRAVRSGGIAHLSALSRRVIDRRQFGVVEIGDVPAPGRSALDQRKSAS